MPFGPDPFFGRTGIVSLVWTDPVSRYEYKLYYEGSEAFFLKVLSTQSEGWMDQAEKLAKANEPFMVQQINDGNREFLELLCRTYPYKLTYDGSDALLLPSDNKNGTRTLAPEVRTIVRPVDGGGFRVTFFNR